MSFARGLVGRGDKARSVQAFTLAVNGPRGLKVEGSVLALEESSRFVEAMLDYGTEPGVWFAGTSRCSDGSGGVIAGHKRKAGNTSMLILYRRFSSDYHSPLAFDMSEGSRGAGNLEAVYTGLVIGRGGALELALYRDVGRRLYRGSGLSGIRFEEFSALLKIRPARKVTLSVSMRGEEEEEGDSFGNTGGVERWGKLRMDSSLRPRPGLEVRSRVEVSVGDSGINPWRAFLLYLDMKMSLQGGFDVRGRFTCYNCDEGGFLYIVEGGLPERSVILRLSGEGERYQLVVTKRIGDGWTARSKLSSAFKRGTVYLAGFDLENWESDLTWEFQLEHKF